jgi:hypothetical protein
MLLPLASSESLEVSVEFFRLAFLSFFAISGSPSTFKGVSFVVEFSSKSVSFDFKSSPSFKFSSFGSELEFLLFISVSDSTGISVSVPLLFSVSFCQNLPN